MGFLGTIISGMAVALFAYLLPVYLKSNEKPKPIVRCVKITNLGDVPLLNVRNAPTFKTDNVVDQLSSGDVVSFLTSEAGWAKVKYERVGAMITGFVSSKYTTFAGCEGAQVSDKPSPAIVEEPIETSPAPPPTATNQPSIDEQLSQQEKNLCLEKRKTQLQLIADGNRYWIDENGRREETPEFQADYDFAFQCLSAYDIQIYH
jgi:hypothetical protein